jgi:flagellar hook-basal body complex protein FliE
MPVPAIDPSFATTGPEWGVGSVAPVQDPSQGAGQSGFGGMLSNAISGLDQSQTQAATAAQSLATGTASDPTAVVMQVEKASLAMQLASQIRTKAVEAENDIFHTQI